ncbi:MAG TPA: alkaline phosphatase family protein [Ktedonobacteraceae bacterium]|nr:alkaline phosphatase family protein [Ktedonobacteraceae bacterium]
MTKVVMLGISGLDADLLRVYGPTLPDLRRLLLHSPFLEMRSCFPPEPLPAWASIYTGLHPANHGIHGHPQEVSLAGVETFWSAASRAGKRVCIINPLLTMPAEKINGIVLAQPFTGTEFEELNRMRAPLPRQLEAFCASLQTRTLQQAAMALELFQREKWDLFFLQLDALDHAQHFLWRYSDPGDPTYPGRNQYASRILEFYRLFNEISGRFRRCIPHDCVLLVVSGHGHGRHCAYRLHINKWLRTQGLLVAQERLQDILPRLARHLPGRRTTHHSLAAIDTQASIAQLVELAGISPFGGISLNRDALARKGESYTRTREALLQKLLQLRVKGYPVVNWAKTREEWCNGAFITRYPDILFELRSDFGVASDLYVPLVTPDTAHRAISGGHTAQGVLLMEPVPDFMDIREGIAEPTVMDVAPIVLRLLGLESGKHDGKSLVSPQHAGQLI